MEPLTAEHSRGQLEAIIEAMADGVAVFGLDGRPVLMNRALARITGFADVASLMQGLPALGEIFEAWTEDGQSLPPDRWPIYRALAGEKVIDDLVRLRRKDTGLEFHAQVSGSPVLDREGKQVMAVIILRDVTEQKRNEKERRRSEEKYRTILESIDDGFCIVRMIYDGDGNGVDYLYLEANQAFQQQTGLMDPVGRTLLSMVPGVDPSWARLYGSVALTGKALRIENFDPAMDRWFDVYASRSGLPEERKVALLFKDITPRKRAQEALHAGEARAKESERFLRRVLDNLFAFVGVCEIDGTLLEVNQAPLEAAGIGAGEVLGRKFWDTPWLNHDPRVQARAEAGCHRAVAGEVVRYDTVIRLSGGEKAVIDFQIAPLRDAAGRITHLIPSAVDVTERSRVQGELHKFALLVEASNDFVAMADRTGVCTFLNAGGRNLVGLDTGSGTGVGIPIWEFFQDVDAEAVRDAWQRTLGGSRWNGELKLRKPDSGEAVPVWCNVFPLRSPETGETFALALVGRDLTLVREKEEQLRQAQKVEAIGRLAGGVAHDFNNLLTAINGYGDMLIESFAPDDPRTEFLKEIRKSGQRAASLTTQLLAYSRKQVLQPRILRLNSLLEDSADFLRRVVGEHIEVRLELAPELLAVKADPDQMHQILLNLCLNARDAMPKGGLLRIRTRNSAPPPGAPRKRGTGLSASHVLLEISDSGMGMTGEVKGRIFEPFFTTKEVGKGTGLGLSSVEGIVQQSGGRILVDSAPGEGATFRIFLPGLNDSQPEAVPEGPAEESAGRGRPGSILLVEDEEAVRKFVRSLLEREGFQVMEARDGLEGKALLESADVKPDLLLSDVVMPHMGGFPLAAWTRQARPEVRILLMSGYTEDTLAKQAGLEEPPPIIQKPFSSQTLIQAIRDRLHPQVEKA